jgi:hypothetical protein
VFATISDDFERTGSQVWSNFNRLRFQDYLQN